jgi:Mn2+/Fe2+ NRAMP family transporter
MTASTSSMKSATPTMEASTAVKSTAAAMESTSMGSTTAEAVAKPAMPTEPAMLAMLMESTPKTADKPATVVGITIAKPIVVGIPIAVGIRIRIVIVVMVMMFLSLSSWCNKHHDTC